MSPEVRQKVALFHPLNAVGHINSSLAIADRLRADFGYRSVFLLVGPPLSQSITNHGHQLIEVPEADPYEDYEIEEDEDTSKPVDEALKQSQGKKRVRFAGARRFPQILARHQHLLNGPPADAFKATGQLAGKFFFAHFMANMAAVEREIERSQADILVLDTFMPPPCVLREELARPWVNLRTANPLHVVQAKAGVVVPRGICRLYSKAERQLMRNEQPDDRWQELVSEWQRVGAELAAASAIGLRLMREFYQSHGYDRLDTSKLGVDSPHLNIYMYPEAIDYDQDDDLFEYPARWLRCDSLMRSPEGEAETAEVRRWSELLDERLAANPKLQVIYFSLGSIASGTLSLMQKYVDILAADEAADRLYVVSKGVNGDRFQLSARNMIGANYLPQPFLLQQSRLAIIHGGNNSVTECLFYGLPTIVLPNFADQFDNAQRIEDLKLGKRLSLHDCRGPALLAAIGELLSDSSLRQKLQAIGKRMQARDELGKVARLINKLAEEKQLEAQLIKELNS